MSEPIGPGDWVECIARGRGNPPGVQFERDAPLDVGRLYRVVKVVRGVDRKSGEFREGVFLTWPRTFIGGVEAAWPLERFRPVYRPKQTVIDSLTAPPERTPEPA